MTFGIGSPGFDPFYCPPCPEGDVCMTVCFDVIDGPVLVFGLVAVLSVSLLAVRWKVEDNDQ